MRGLEEIKARNERPHAYHDDSNNAEVFGSGHRHAEHEGARPTDDTLQKILEEISGGRPKNAADITTELLAKLVGTNAPKTYTDVANETLAAYGDVDPNSPKGRKIGELFAYALILDACGVPYSEPRSSRTLADRSRLNDKGDRFLGMEGIHSAIDAQPPFLRFWQKLNDDRAAGGHGEASYKEAKTAYQGGETPHGTLTFVGKEWDGLRAVPAKPYDGKKSYHGEFKQSAEDESTVWRVVANNTDGPISYATPEAALNAARHARIHSEASKS